MSNQPTEILWECPGLQVHLTRENGEKAIKLVMPESRLVALTRQQSFEMCHKVTDELSKWPRSSG